MFLGGGHVEDIRGRSGGAGVDHAFRRDDCGVGAADSPALRLHPRVRRGAGLGEKRDGGDNRPHPAWTPRARGITIGGRVGLEGGLRSLKPQ